LFFLSGCKNQTGKKGMFYSQYIKRGMQSKEKRGIQIEIEIPCIKKEHLERKEESLQNVENLIHEKKMFLLGKKGKMEEEEKKNEFLRGIRNDYEKYYDYTVEEKEKQVRFMNYLIKYIDQLMKEGELTEEDLKRAEWEQHKLMMEIMNIKKDLDEITKKIE